jgi:hypothetical protein
MVVMLPFAKLTQFIANLDNSDDEQRAQTGDSFSALAHGPTLRRKDDKVRETSFLTKTSEPLVIPDER